MRIRANTAPTTMAMHDMSGRGHGLSAKQLAFHDAMRKLWEDHVTWTRLFIVSFAADLPDLEQTTNRLLQNQVDIGDAIKPFYGKAAARQLTDLLTTHITTAATLLQAAKDGDTDAFNEAKDACTRTPPTSLASSTRRTPPSGRSRTSAR